MELVTPGLGLIFWMTLSFLIVVFILRKFAWRPILKALKERESNITDALHAADKAKADMELLKFSNEKLLKEAKDERDAILREARKVKDAMIEDAKLKANEEANRIIEGARESIQFEKMAAITELKNQIANLSIEIAEKILREELSGPAKQKDYIAGLVDQVNLN